MSKYRSLFLIITVLSGIVFSCSTDPADLAKRYPETYNTHKVEEIVSLYADDAVFEVAGNFSLFGKDQIRNITKYDSVMNIHMTISNIITRGDTVVCNLTETNDWLKTAEIGEAFYTVKFIFHDGLIKHLQANTMPETQQAFSQVLSPLMEWAAENNEKTITEMMPDGKFIYSAENAEKNLALLRSWKSSLKK